MLNAKKYRNVQFGGKKLSVHARWEKNLDWVGSWTYLGVTILSRKEFSIALSPKKSRTSTAVPKPFLLDDVLANAIEVSRAANKDSRGKLRVANESMLCQDFGDGQSDSRLRTVGVSDGIPAPAWSSHSGPYCLYLLP